MTTGRRAIAARFFSAIVLLVGQPSRLPAGWAAFRIPNSTCNQLLPTHWSHCLITSIKPSCRSTLCILLAAHARIRTAPGAKGKARMRIEAC